MPGQRLTFDRRSKHRSVAFQPVEVAVPRVPPPRTGVGFRGEAG